MEIEYFISPDADWQSLHKGWIEYCVDWFDGIGIPKSRHSLYQSPAESP